MRRCLVAVAVLAAVECCLADAPAVKVRRSTVTLPWYTCVRKGEVGHHLEAISALDGTIRRIGRRELEVVELANRYLRVRIVPEMGGAVGRVIYRPTGEDMFFREGKVKDWTPFWESGVKVNAPSCHHPVSTEDQPASWRVVRADDGSVTVAMWMEFSRFDEARNDDFYGRFSTQMLSQHVTLRPERADFVVTYRLVNPSPWRQARKVWVDALYPRTHTADGVVQGGDPPPETTSTEWVFPAAWVCGHRGRNVRRLRPEDLRLGAATQKHNSLFALDVKHGFAGLWYPEAKVNRLRICDPDIVPCAKQYYRGDGHYRPNDLFDSHMFNFVELWGGPDHVMEGVENWLAPGEAFEAEFRFYMTTGIGKVHYADANVAVHAGFGAGGRVEVTTLEPVEALTVELDGEPLGEPAPCGPERPARFDLPSDATAGRLRVVADGRTLADRRFPLEIPDDTSAHARILAACDQSDPAALERYGDQHGYRRALNSLLRKGGEKSLMLGRMLYRDGRLGEAVRCLEAVTDRQGAAGEAWGLLGAARLERHDRREAREALERALGADEPWPAAGYYLALLDLRAGRPDEAAGRLEALRKSAPNHWEGRLLAAWLAGQDDPTREHALAELRAMASEDPADPRVQTALEETATLAGDEEAAKRAADALDDLTAEPGAWRRLREFGAATRGVHLPPRRMQQR